MNHKTAVIASTLLLTLFFNVGTTRADDGKPIDSLVSTEWLAAHLDDPNLIVLDCSVIVSANADGEITASSGHDRYLEGHIPGAGFADLKGDLVDTDSPLGYAVPAPEAFAAAMGALGVGDNSRVVLYDRGETAWAARVWWMLRWIGFDNAALLDGGLPAWEAEGRPLSSALPERDAGTLSVQARPELIADRDEVFAAIDDSTVSLIDALPAEHYRGEQVMYARPGHIEGAVNVPVFSLVNESGRFRPDRGAALAVRRAHERPQRHLLRWRHRGIVCGIRHDPTRLRGRCGLHRITPGMGRGPGKPDGHRGGARRGRALTGSSGLSRRTAAATNARPPNAEHDVQHGDRQ